MRTMVYRTWYTLPMTDYKTWYTLPMTDYRTWNTTDDTSHNTDFYKDECEKRSKQRNFIYAFQLLQPV